MRTIGRYQITRELGRGAMGVVYHAVDPTIGRSVAIKTLRLRDVDDAEQRKRLRERLFREARSAGALSHPGIVTIYDMDEVDGLAYIAMEFVDGETLEDVLAKPEPLSRERFFEIMRQAAAAIDYAHRKGIIHRDIKPANIMIDASGAVKITDFGIAKITQLDGQTLTGVLVGTPNYMSPEQVQGQEIDGRSDQFSLAVIAWEILAGERPFYGEQISTVVYKIVTEQPPPVQNVNGSLNEQVDRALRRGMAKKPERRFNSCTAFVTGLNGALETTRNWRVIARKPLPLTTVASTEAATRTVSSKVQRVAARAKPHQARPKAAPQPNTGRKRGGWLFPFVAAFLFLATILLAVAWQTGFIDFSPFLAQIHSEAAEQGNPNDAREEPPLPAVPEPPGNQQIETDENRPSPVPSGVEKSPQSVNPEPLHAQQAKPEVAPVYHQVSISTDPPGALATIDGQNDLTCHTPCTLNARPGTHNVTLRQDGYFSELREIAVVDQDIALPLVILRSTTGTVMISSDPGGAEIYIDGQRTGQLTPARLVLQPGPHQVTISKEGLEASGEVEVRSGGLTPIRLSVKRR